MDRVVVARVAALAAVVHHLVVAAHRPVAHRLAVALAEVVHQIRVVVHQIQVRRKEATMNKKYKIAGGTLISTLAVVALPLSSAMAWGPDRQLYTNASPADHPTFNSIQDNAAVGDERDFVRIAEITNSDTKNVYVSNLKVEPGKSYEVWIYYHNNASATYNDEAHNYSGVARDVRVASQFSQVVTPADGGEVSAKITSSNATPSAIWDEAKLTSDQNVHLHYHAASAKIYNDWKADGSVLSTNLFSPQGTFIGLNELNGVILGCDEYSGMVVYHLDATGEGEPTPPGTEEVTTPGEMPETGPAEIIIASVIVLAIIGGGIYWYKTHKAVKNTKRKVTTRKKTTRKPVAKKRK